MSLEDILSVIGQDINNIETNIIHDFDWNESSVDCVYIIFFTGRCGSTWLVHLLADSGLCGRPEELFNETVMPRFNMPIKATNFREYFAGVVSSTKSGGRFGFKIDGARFLKLLPLVNFRDVFPSSKTHFFWMTRRDLVGQAFSYSMAKATGRWHDFVARPVETSCEKVDLSDSQMWGEMLSIVSNENKMRKFFAEQNIQPVCLDYEQMMSDRVFVIIKIMNELGCTETEINNYVTKMEDKTTKITSDNKYDTMISFYFKYKKIIDYIDTNRFAIDTNEIKTALKLSYNINI